MTVWAEVGRRRFLDRDRHSPHRISRRRPVRHFDKLNASKLKERLGFCDSPSRGE